MLFLFILWLAFGGLCGYIGGQKGRSEWGWFAAGLFLGIFALIAIIAVPSIKKTEGV